MDVSETHFRLLIKMKTDNLMRLPVLYIFPLFIDYSVIPK